MYRHRPLCPKCQASTMLARITLCLRPELDNAVGQSTLGFKCDLDHPADGFGARWKGLLLRTSASAALPARVMEGLIQCRGFRVPTAPVYGLTFPVAPKLSR
jgi:hypothetical protein